MATKLKKGEYPYYVDYKALRRVGACSDGAVDAMRQLLQLDGQRVHKQVGDFLDQRVYLSADLLKRIPEGRKWWISYKLYQRKLLTASEFYRFRDAAYNRKKIDPMIDVLVPKIAARRAKKKHMPQINFTDERLRRDAAWSLRTRARRY